MWHGPTTEHGPESAHAPISVRPSVRPLRPPFLNESVGKSSGWLRNDPWRGRVRVAKKGARIIDSNGQKTASEREREREEGRRVEERKGVCAAFGKE